MVQVPKRSGRAIQRSLVIRVFMFNEIFWKGLTFLALGIVAVILGLSVVIGCLGFAAGKVHGNEPSATEVDDLETKQSSVKNQTKLTEEENKNLWFGRTKPPLSSIW